MLNTCRPTRRERHRRYGWRGLLRPRAAPLESICYARASRVHQPPKAEPTVRALTLDLLYVAWCRARVQEFFGGLSCRGTSRVMDKGPRLERYSV